MKDLSAAAREVLAFHRRHPDTTTNARPLGGKNACLQSVDDLLGAYFELAKAGWVEEVPDSTKVYVPSDGSPRESYGMYRLKPR